MDTSPIGGNNALIMNQALFNMNNNRSIDRINVSQLSGDDAALFEAAVEFEAYFIEMMLRAMRDTVNTDQGILPPNEGERIFREMLDEETARNAARAGGIGLAQQIFRQMTSQRSLIQEQLMQETLAYGGEYGAAMDTVNVE